MLWFLLFGLIGYGLYKTYRYYWYRSLVKKVSRYQNVLYKKLPPPEKKELRKLVNTILDSGISLDEETNKIVTPLYQEMEIEDLYNLDGMNLRISKDRQRKDRQREE